MSEDSTIAKLIPKLASPHLEQLASDTSFETLAETVCAFLNSEGGTILVGGASQEAARQRSAAFEQYLRAHLHPASLWSVSVAEAQEQFWLVIDVPAGRDRPYTVSNTIFLRHGSRTVKAKADELRSLVENSYRGTERWERRLLPNAGLDRLDRALIQETVASGRNRRYEFSDPQNLESVLKDLSLWRDESITHAAEILFGKRPAIQFPQIRARVTVYGSGKGGDFIDNRQFEGPVLSMLEGMVNMLRQHTPIRAVFPAGMLREDRAGYPEPAVREGLVNALVHRDYDRFDGGIAVDLYPDRLVIWNSGTLPPGMKLGDLKKDHPSMPRNPDIAQVFFLNRQMERIGRGTQKILEQCAASDLPAPRWNADEKGVTLTFKAATGGTLNRRQLKFVRELADAETARLADYCERLAVSERQARRDLTELVRQGFLAKEGDGPATLFRRTAKAAPAG